MLFFYFFNKILEVVVMNENHLGKLLQELRNQKGLTQKELAAKLHVSDKAISKWETGVNLPTMQFIPRIAKFYNVPIDDLLTARILDDEHGEEVSQKIISDITKENIRKSKLIKIISIISFLAILILTIAYIFTRTYNKFKFYHVYLEEDDLSISNGVYVETRIRDSMYINNIKLLNYKIKNTDTISINLYYLENDKEYVLQCFSKLDYINYIDNESLIKVDDLSKYFDKLYLKVIVIDENGDVQEFTGKLIFTLDFSNNKIFYKEKDNNELSNNKINYSNDEIKSILLKNGFEETSNGIFYKKENKYSIHYNININKFNYNFEENNLNYRFRYYFNDNILEVSIINKNNIEIEGYTYDVNNDKIVSCIIGKCNGYKEAMNILNKNVLYLFK